MVIAVYADLKAYQSSEEDLYFVKGFIRNLAAICQEHQFHLIGEDIIDEFVENSISLVPLKVKTGLLYQYRLHKQVIQIIKKIKADVLLSFDAIFKISASQSLLISSFKENKFSPAKLQSLKGIFVLSGQVKEELISQYKIDLQKIGVLYGGPAKPFLPVSEQVKSSVKEKYTEGKEYFIYRGSIKKQNNIIPLLKAFSFFKKRQKSTMKLVLMGKPVWQNDGFYKLINTYKYREDVVIASDLQETEQAKLLGAAYAFIQPYPSNNLLFDFDAMQCYVPVLADHTTLLKYVAPDIVLYFDSAHDADLANKMMLIYKDEALRSQLIEQGNNFVKTYNWGETIDLLWKNLQQP